LADGTVAHNCRVKTARYQFVVQQPNPNSWRWGWEIYRDGQPLPVRLRGGKHSSKLGAERAGAKALGQFLVGLEQEQGAR
jgi:hypothetical protein